MEYGIPLLVIGIILLYFGGKWIIKMLKPKEYAELTVEDTEMPFFIEAPGLFSVGFVGGKYVRIPDEFLIEIKDQHNQQPLQLTKKTLKYTFLRKWRPGVEGFHFNIQSAGEYVVSIRNLDKVVVSKIIFSKPLPTEQILVVIRESLSLPKRVMGIIFITLGINMFVWGILLSLGLFDT